MKFPVKALSVTLLLASLLGACSSVNSSNPSVEDPAVNGGVELESSEGFDGLETNEQSLDAESTEMEDSGIGASEEPMDLESAEMEDPNLEASEEPMDLESAEMEDPNLEASEEPMDLESAEMENLDLEAVEQETPEIEASETFESQDSELILPTEETVETPTESEAAENSPLESNE